VNPVWSPGGSTADGHVKRDYESLEAVSTHMSTV
jgi:hypothetical protein